MKNPKNKQRKEFNSQRKEEVKQVVKSADTQEEISSEIVLDINNMLTTTIEQAKEKYPDHTAAIDKFLDALGNAMTEILSDNSNEESEEEDSEDLVDCYGTCMNHTVKPVLPDYDKALDKMRDMKKKRDERKKSDEEYPFLGFFDDDDEDEEDSRLPRLRSTDTNTDSSVSTWYEVFYTLDKSETEGSMRVRASSESEAESKVIMMVDEDCTIDSVNEVESEDDDDEIFIPDAEENEDEDYDIDDPNYSLMASVYKHMKGSRF